MVAKGNQAVTSGQEAGDGQEAMVVQGAAADVCQPDPKDRHPQWKAALGIQPGGGWTHPALCGPGGSSPLKMQVQTLVQK